MTKEDLLKLGLTEEQVKTVLDGFKDHVAKETHEELKTENTRLLSEVKDRDKQLNSLKTSVKDVEGLQEQINALQEENKQKDETHKQEFTKAKIESAIDIAITKANGKNPKAIKALLDLESVKFEDGKVTGLDKQFEKLVKGEDSSFLFGETKASFKGVAPGSSDGNKTNSITKEDFSKMGYKERVELHSKDKELYNELKTQA